ncbi:MAG TPA: beta-galactosidase, partial [Sunxiuqinia sp.]|nr:beta-galactosidase [Sunxiuqinia sp.]
MTRYLLPKLNLWLWGILIFLVSCANENQKATPERTQAGSEVVSIPHLEQVGHATHLMVRDKPFLILGGELHNSSSSNVAYLDSVMPRLSEAGLNTVLAPVSWDLLEPEEGQFDFSLMDGLIQSARKNNLHLIVLWFGSWKN